MIIRLFCISITLALSTSAFSQKLSKSEAALKDAVLVGKDTQMVRTGYLALPRKQVSSAIATLPGEKLNSLLGPNVKTAMQGQVAGVQVIQANGMPGSANTVRIRGTSSIYAETEPLILIDGIPAYAGPREVADQGIGNGWGAQFNPLSDMNMDDIESVEVLKDAAATAMYGTRGGNGVILITTKKGDKKRPAANVNYFKGVTSPTNRIKSLNGSQYLQLLNESWINSGQTGQGPLPTIAGYTRAIAEGTNTDNLSDILGSGTVQQFNLSTSYVSNQTTFYLSGAYHNEKGILSGNNLNRYSGRMNITNQIGKNLNIGVNLALNLSDNSNMPVGYSVGGGFNAAQKNLPVFPLYNANGTLFYAMDPSVIHTPGSNVAAFQNDKEFINIEHTNRFFLAVNFTYKLARNLIFSTDVSMERYYQNFSNYVSRRLRNGSIGSGIGREGVPTAYAGYEKYSNNAQNAHSTLTYKKISARHRFTAVAGYEYNYNENPEFFGEGEGFANDFTKEPGAAAYRNVTTALGLVANTNTLIGYFANVNYAFDDKYLIGATARYDGSSRFGANNMYALFPAVSVGWAMSKENFLKHVKVIDQLKLRASYGRSGNAGIGNYSSKERWSINANSRYLLQSGIQMLTLGSPDLKPEFQDQLNIGLDFSVLKNRISGTVDYYNKTTSNLIINYMAPLSIGVAQTGLLLNAGSLRNRGVELSITSKNIIGKKISWTTELNIAHNNNKVLDLGGLTPDQLMNHDNIITTVGQPLGTFYLAEYAGVDPDTGKEMIYDAGGNKVAAARATQIDSARRIQTDRPSAPKWFGGLNNTLVYKKFELSALITFSLGNYILDEGERDLSYITGNNNLRDNAMDRWTAQNHSTVFPQLVYNDPVAGSNTTRFLHDGSYARMKNISLSYSFKHLLPKVDFLKAGKIYISAQNLFTITGFKGWDPEVVGNYNSNVDRSLNQGITYMELPQIRTIVAGINLNL